jgi:hypothetical protein
VAAVAVIAIALVGANLYRGSNVGPGSSVVPSPPTSAIPSTSPSPRLLTLPLNPVEGAQAHGTVAIEVKGDSYTVTVTIEGLTPNSIHKLYLNAGTCNAIKSNVGRSPDPLAAARRSTAPARRSSRAAKPAGKITNFGPIEVTLYVMYIVPMGHALSDPTAPAPSC